jgi:two-component system cell cycle sensor histidine kinase PleC
MTRSPRQLLSSFILTTIGGLVIVIGLSLVATDRIIAAFALDDGEVHNKMLARAVSNALEPELRAWLAATEGEAAELDRAEPGYRALERGVHQVTRDLPTLKVELYRPDGTVIFSTGADALGVREGPENEAFWQAVGGDPYSTVEFDEDFVDLQGEPFHRDAVTSYLPLSYEGELLGVFEIYSDYALVLALANTYFPKVAALVLAACLLLYLTVLLFVWRAQRSLSAARDELADARTRADAANRAKSRFLANMSHELRTPLNAILGFSEVLADQRFGPIGNHKYREYASDIQLSGQHLRSLIDDVLDMAKIEAGSVEVEMRTFDLRDLIADVVRMMQGRTAAAGQSLVSDLPETPVRLRSDPRLVRQILLNLLSNATKFTPAGGEIRVSMAYEGARAQVSISDTGIGMSTEDLETACRPFGQTRRGKAQGQAGTGLGLSICKSLTELLGAEMAISSCPDAGTEVRLALPAAQSQEAPALPYGRSGCLDGCSDSPAVTAEAGAPQEPTGDSAARSAVSVSAASS